VNLEHSQRALGRLDPLFYKKILEKQPKLLENLRLISRAPEGIVVKFKKAI